MNEINEDNQEKNPTANKEVSVMGGSISITYNSEPLNKIADAVNEKNMATGKKTDETNALVVRQATAQERANRINQRLFVSNLFVFAVTALIFIWNIKGVAAAEKAAKAATDAVTENRRANDLAQRSFDSGTADNERRFKLDKKNTQDQIAALHNQFKTDNAPYLEAVEPTIEPLEIGKAIKWKCNIENLGKYPVKILEVNSLTTTRFNKPKYDEIYKQSDYNFSANHYITSTKPLELDNESTKMLPNGNYSNLIEGKSYIYLWGYLRYINLVTMQKREYRFMYKINVHDNNKAYFLLNENGAYKTNGRK